MVNNPNKVEKKIYSIEKFSQEYNALKKEGKIPYEIKNILEEKYDCADTTYYGALRLGREKGIICDTYKENVIACNKRRRNIFRELISSSNKEYSLDKSNVNVTRKRTAVSKKRTTVPNSKSTQVTPIKKVSFIITIIRRILRFLKK